VEARLYQATESRRFDRELQSKLNNISMPPPGLPREAVVPEEGGIVGRLEIPRIRISVMVVEGAESGDLERGAGHIPGTALPGERGNVGIAAHRDTFFRPLRSIRRDDTITVRTIAGAYCYRVVSTKVVTPEDVQVLYPTRRDSLTLVTCFPFDYVGSAPMRFIVRAERCS
jgi:sortase A